MSNTNLKLNATKREILGKKSKKIRTQDQIPASIYGANFEPISIQINLKDFKHVFSVAKFSKVVELELGSTTYKTIVREVQTNPVTSEILSAQFLKLDENRKVKLSIPFNIIGTSLAVKNNLGFLVNPIDSVPVKCLSSKIPENLTVDITVLENVGDSLLIKDLQLPEGVEFQPGTNIYAAIATIVPPQKEVVVAQTTVAATDTTTTATADAAKSTEVKETEKTEKK